MNESEHVWVVLTNESRDQSGGDCGQVCVEKVLLRDDMKQGFRPRIDIGVFAFPCRCDKAQKRFYKGSRGKVVRKSRQRKSSWGTKIQQ